MGEMSIWHWLIVLIIVLLVFGSKKIRNVGTDLGHAIRDFKKGLNEDESMDGDEAADAKPEAQLGADNSSASVDKETAQQARQRDD